MASCFHSLSTDNFESILNTLSLLGAVGAHAMLMLSVTCGVGTLQ